MIRRHFTTALEATLFIDTILEDPGRMKRSEAYKAGARRGFLRSMGVVVDTACLDAAGSAECDAFYAGLEEGRHIAAWYKTGLDPAASDT